MSDKILLTYEIDARQGDDGHEDGLVKLHLQRSYGGYTRFDVNTIVDQLQEVVRRMAPEAAPSLRDRVFASCDRAVENGYVEDFEGSGKTIYDVDPMTLATDTLDCDADFDGLGVIDVFDHVREWQDARRPR